eukprot:gene22763-31053_t
MLDAAHYLLRPLILRRVKSEVETLLPPKLETLINCPMSDMQVLDEGASSQGGESDSDPNPTGRY